jgi:RHS repeat-associated protein
MTLLLVCVLGDASFSPSISTGKERDSESGNDYFGARYYASSMGRWLSPDWSAKEEPVPYAKLDDPQSLNLYGYLSNNPLSGVDADGHDGPDCGCPTLQLPQLPTKQDLQVAAAVVLTVGYMAIHNLNPLNVFHSDAPAGTTAGATTEGTYEFPDATAPGKTYVGQSSNVPRRLGEHEASGKKGSETEAKTKPVNGGKTARELAETKRIKDLGGTSGKEGSQTSNKRLPVSDKRMEKIKNGSSN